MLTRTPGLEVNQELRHSRRQKQECTYTLEPVTLTHWAFICLASQTQVISWTYKNPLSVLWKKSTVHRLWEVTGAHFLWKKLTWRFPKLLVLDTTVSDSCSSISGIPLPWYMAISMANSSSDTPLLHIPHHHTSPCAPSLHHAICPISDQTNPPSKPAISIPHLALLF